MVKIEVNNVTVSVPQSWGDISLGEYETYYKEKPETGRQRVEYVAKILKMDAAVLLSWPAEVFNTIVDTLGFLFTDNPIDATPVVDVDGVPFIVSIEDKITLGAWVDAEEAQKADSAVLSTVLAIVCRPAGEAYDYQLNEQRQKQFAALPMSKVLGVLAFFLRCKSDYDRLTAAFTKVRQMVALLPPSIKPFRARGGGIKLLQIWQAMKYYALIKLLNYRLRKLSRSFNTAATRP